MDSSPRSLAAWVLLIFGLALRTVTAIPVTTNSTISSKTSTYPFNNTTAGFNATFATFTTNHTLSSNISSLPGTNITSFASTAHYRGPGPKIPQGGDPSVVPPWNTPPKIPLHFNGARWGCPDNRYFGAICTNFDEGRGSWYWGICGQHNVMPWGEELECHPCIPHQYMQKWCGYAECEKTKYGGPKRRMCGHVAPYNVDDPIVDNKPDYGGAWLPGIDDYPP